MCRRTRLTLSLLCALMLVEANAWAGTTNGTETVAIGPITVSYTGEVLSDLNTNNPSPAFRDIITLEGGPGSGVDTLTFSTVLDLIMGVWSPGSGGSRASFVFTPSESFTMQSGGPWNEFHGGPKTKWGNVVNGVERTWTNPQAELDNGFTAGSADVPSTPEPSIYLSLLIGLLCLALVLRGRWVKGPAPGETICRR